MYVSLWNFRANLLSFNDELSNFTKQVLIGDGIFENDADV
jgi:hypothetical protein